MTARPSAYVSHTSPSPRENTVPSLIPPETERSVKEHLSVQGVIRAYQVRGHLVARLDPLCINNKERNFSHSPAGHQILGGKDFEFSQRDMDRVFQLPGLTWIGGDNETSLPLKEIIKRLEVRLCH